MVQVVPAPCFDFYNSLGCQTWLLIQLFPNLKMPIKSILVCEEKVVTSFKKDFPL